MLDFLKIKLKKTFNFNFNRNQFHEICRLLYEVHRRDKTSYPKIIGNIKKDESIFKVDGKNRFTRIKQNLTKIRFPLTSLKQDITPKSLFLAPLKKPLSLKQDPPKEFSPEEIFVEKKARDSYLVHRFKEKFPKVKIEELNFSGEYLKNHKFSLSQLKRPLVFIAQEQWDFIKPCPCTKYHLRCNYWILNLGFGCPFDCSYCFLQQYSNFPGIVLPSNLDDFFNKFEDFYKKINRPIRIGTGEFCDSLALDKITGYTHQLINFFKNKSVYFELKTKSDKIDNLLKIDASPNIIISWSLNPQKIIENEELGTASLAHRLKAAKRVREKGFSLAFHFDPIIYSKNWQILYRELIDKLYTSLNGPFKWISFGTLRGSRALKSIAEQRFPKSNIFYEELLLGVDKKLRYPKFLRQEIYQNMLSWIKKYDTKTPIYLCMEDKDTWQALGKHFNYSRQIERYLIAQP